MSDSCRFWKAKVNPVAVLSLAAILSLTACTQRSLPGAGGNIVSDLTNSQNRPGAMPDENGIVTRGNIRYIMAREGDDMQSLASRAGITSTALALYNGLPESYRPKAGEELAIPPAPQPDLSSNISQDDQSSIETSSLGTDNLSTPTQHTVIAGETIFEVARLYNVPVADLARANGLGGDLTISPGQVLTIPVQTASVDNTATTTDANPAPTNSNVETSSSSGFRAPVTGSISQGYDPASDADGYVYSTTTHAPVYATSGGEVVLINRSTGDQGTVVMIRHPDNLISIYGHMSDLKVSKGDQVSKGDLLGTTEETELMFQIRQGTSPVDPANYI